MNAKNFHRNAVRPKLDQSHSIAMRKAGVVNSFVSLAFAAVSGGTPGQWVVQSYADEYERITDKAQRTNNAGWPNTGLTAGFGCHPGCKIWSRSSIG